MLTVERADCERGCARRVVGQNIEDHGSGCCGDLNSDRGRIGISAGDRAKRGFHGKQSAVGRVRVERQCGNRGSVRFGVASGSDCGHCSTGED